MEYYSKEIFNSRQTVSSWVRGGIQACDFSMFEADCKPMVEAGVCKAVWNNCDARVSHVG